MHISMMSTTVDVVIPVKGSPPLPPFKADSDPMDLEYNSSKDVITGADSIKGGR